MCYLIAKKMDTIGCLAIQMSHGQHLADFKEMLLFCFVLLFIRLLQWREKYKKYNFSS